MAIVIDSITTYDSGATKEGGPSFSVTTPAGRPRQLLLVLFGFGSDDLGNPRQVTSMTYAGQAMTRAVGLDNLTDENAVAYYRVAPTAGANTLAISTNITGRNRAAALMLSNVDQSTPTPNTGSQNTTSDTATITITSSIGNTIFDIYCKAGSATPTIGADQTQRFDLSTSPDVNGSTQPGTDPTGVMSWTFTASSHLVYLAVDVKAAPTGGSQTLGMFSRLWDFYRGLEAGRLPAGELRRRYGELMSI